jgi:hypothetical protein
MSTPVTTPNGANSSRIWPSVTWYDRLPAYRRRFWRPGKVGKNGWGGRQRKHVRGNFYQQKAAQTGNNTDE